MARIASLAAATLTAAARVRDRGRGVHRHAGERRLPPRLAVRPDRSAVGGSGLDSLGEATRRPRCEPQPAQRLRQLSPLWILL
jgi:hypothetical protein